MVTVTVSLSHGDCRRLSTGVTGTGGHGWPGLGARACRTDNRDHYVRVRVTVTVGPDIIITVMITVTRTR